MPPPSHRSSLAVVRLLAAASLAVGLALPASANSPSGRMVVASHVTIPPAWLDPSTAPAQITPFAVLYALHDALVRPYPGQRVGASLAESWSESADAKTYEFKLRPGLKFHNGDPITTEDVKFSYERYKGSGFRTLQDNIERVEIVDPLVVRFHLKAPWPDFMTFFGTSASAVGLVLPKKYLTEVGDEGFKKAPVGAGPYKFVRQRPGIELELEAFTGYWRKVPSVKTLILKSVPESTTRAVMLKSGESDFSVVLDGPDAESVRSDPRLQLVATKHASMIWVEFTEQWNPKSPWHDIRVRQAVNLALDRKAISEAACLGFCPPAGVIVPRVMDFALQVEPPAADRAKAKRLLAEAGFPNGFDAGDFYATPGFPTVADAIVSDLASVGIRVRLRQTERATFLAEWRDKKLRGLVMTAVGSAGNAASRVEAFIQSKGGYAYGGYPDIDEMFARQEREPDPKKREALLHQIQQLSIDRVMFAPIYDLRSLVGISGRIAKHTIGDTWLSASPSYEDVELK